MRQSFPRRLGLGIVVIVLLTTMSAGLPAYLLMQNELERQAWQLVANARIATQSLLQAEQERLENVAVLLSARPTLQRWLQETPRTELSPYVRTFQQQSGLDILLICDAAGNALTGSSAVESCAGPLSPHFQIVADQPAVLIWRPIVDETTGDEIGQIVAGNWSNAAFLTPMAATTGVELSILDTDGRRLTTTLTPAELSNFCAGDTGRSIFQAGCDYYYTRSFAITSDDAPMLLYAEVALPANPLRATEVRAVAILVTSTVIVALLAIALGIWTMRRLVAPLEQLTRTAEQISAGELTATIPILNGPVEVTTLAAALQKSQATMLATLDELAQAHAWLDSLVQSIVEGVVTFDSKGNVTFLNQKAAALAQTAPEEAVGRHINELFAAAEEGGASFLDLLPQHGGKTRVSIRPSSAAEGGRTSKFASRLGQPTPRRIGPVATPVPKAIVEITGSNVRSKDGEPSQTAIVLRDISEEESLRQLRSYFLANITHEFRTPLSTLNASLELLMDDVDTLSPAEIRELLRPLHLSLLGLRTLIDNLLESSSIEAGRFTLRKRPGDLNQIIGAALQMVQPLLERRRQSVSLTAAPDLPVVEVDAPRLTQALVNLLTNASKYSDIGSAIDLTVEQRADAIRIAVADRGPGVPAAERAALFGRFVRVDKPDKEQYGIGLGLSVVKSTVEAHGGRAGIDNRTGGGAIFWFELPLKKGGYAQ